MPSGGSSPGPARLSGPPLSNRPGSARLVTLPARSESSVTTTAMVVPARKAGPGRLAGAMAAQLTGPVRLAGAGPPSPLLCSPGTFTFTRQEKAVMVHGVEGLYCKRPIQSLASSEILTPPPHRPASVYPPPLVWGEDTLAGWRGGGGSIVRKTPDTALYSVYVSTLWSMAFLIYKLVFSCRYFSKHFLEFRQFTIRKNDFRDTFTYIRSLQP